MYGLIQTNQTIDFNGYPIAYHQSGNGQAIIMMHNGGSSHIIWKNQIEHFSQTHAVFALDLLGFGDSGRPKQAFTLDLYVEALQAFIQKNKIEKPILMGNCIGAAIALEYAQQNPTDIHSLVLCNICGGVSMMRYFHPYMFTKKEEVHSDKRYAWMFSISKFGYVREKVVERLYGAKPIKKDEVFKRVLKGLEHPLQAQSRLMLIKGLGSFSKFDHYEQDHISLPPTIVFWGEKNRVLPIKRGRLLIERLSPDSHKIYPKQGHLLMAEEPTRFNRDVDVFLEGKKG